MKISYNTSTRLWANLILGGVLIGISVMSNPLEAQSTPAGDSADGLKLPPELAKKVDLGIGIDTNSFGANAAFTRKSPFDNDALTKREQAPEVLDRVYWKFYSRNTLREETEKSVFSMNAKVGGFLYSVAASYNDSKRKTTKSFRVARDAVALAETDLLKLSHNGVAGTPADILSAEVIHMLEKLQRAQALQDKETINELQTTFRDTYGTGFITEMTLGGAAQYSLERTANSREEARHIDARMQASFAFVKLRGEVDKETEALSSDVMVNASGEVIGSAGALMMGMSLKDLFNYLDPDSENTWLEKVRKGRPQKLRAVYQSYSSIPALRPLVVHDIASYRKRTHAFGAFSDSVGFVENAGIHLAKRGAWSHRDIWSVPQLIPCGKVDTSGAFVTVPCVVDGNLGAGKNSGYRAAVWAASAQHKAMKQFDDFDETVPKVAVGASLGLELVAIDDSGEARTVKPIGVQSNQRQFQSCENLLADHGASLRPEALQKTTAAQVRVGGETSVLQKAIENGGYVEDEDGNFIGKLGCRTLVYFDSELIRLPATVLRVANSGISMINQKEDKRPKSGVMTVYVGLHPPDGKKMEASAIGSDFLPVELAADEELQLTVKGFDGDKDDFSLKGAGPLYLAVYRRQPKSGKTQVLVHELNSQRLHKKVHVVWTIVSTSATVD
ncbi:MAG: hypothetical protein AAF483_07680 [Planctomycetota bacterium]